MKKFISILFILISTTIIWAQEIKVEYDKDRDFSKYKTFSFGEGEIITPKDQKLVSDATVHKWIKTAIGRELEMKGLQQVDSAADLVVSYAAGTLARSDAGNVGPLGMTPGSTDRTYIRDYQQGSLVIDLNDKSNMLVLRINSTTNMIGDDGERMVDQIVEKGFRKFGRPVKKKKKK